MNIIQKFLFLLFISLVFIQPAWTRRSSKSVNATKTTTALNKQTKTSTTIQTTPSNTPNIPPDNSLPVENQPAFNAILISGIVSAEISFISSIVVILCVIKDQQCNNEKSSTGKYPLIFASNDILFTLFNLTNLLYILISQEYPSSNVCALFGASQFLFGGFNFMFVFLNAVYVYLLIVRQINLDLGLYQWKIIVPSICTSSLLVIFCASMNGFGPMKYWYVFSLISVNYI